MKNVIMDEALVRELFSYDAEEGHLRHLSIRQGAKNGNRVGSKDKKGYIKVNVLGRCYKEHRLIWLHHYGEWPNGQIDHINGDKSDNRIQNLRVATASQNSMNKSASSLNKCRVKGVGWVPKLNRWRAKIFINGKFIHLGYFNSIDEASMAYNTAAAREFGEFAKLNVSGIGV